MPTDSCNLQYKNLSKPPAQATDAHGFLQFTIQKPLRTTHSSHGCPRIPAIYNTKAPPDHTLKPRMPTDSCNLQHKSPSRPHTQATDAHGFLQFTTQKPLQTTHSSHGCPRIPASYNMNKQPTTPTDA